MHCAFTLVDGVGRAGASASLTPSELGSVACFLRQACPQWSLSEVKAAENTLAKVGVDSVVALAEALRSGDPGGGLNSRLLSAKERSLSEEALEALRARLRQVEERSFSEEALEALRARLRQVEEQQAQASPLPEPQQDVRQTRQGGGGDESGGPVTQASLNSSVSEVQSNGDSDLEEGATSSGWEDAGRGDAGPDGGAGGIAIPAAPPGSRPPAAVQAVEDAEVPSHGFALNESDGDAPAKAKDVAGERAASGLSIDVQSELKKGEHIASGDLVVVQSPVQDDGLEEVEEVEEEECAAPAVRHPAVEDREAQAKPFESTDSVSLVTATEGVLLEEEEEEEEEELLLALADRPDQGEDGADAEANVADETSAFDGCWVSSNDELMGTIVGKLITSPDGATRRMLQVGPHWFKCDWFGQELTASLNKEYEGQLEWSDGDRWMRAPAAPADPPPAAAAAAPGALEASPPRPALGSASVAKRLAAADAKAKGDAAFQAKDFAKAAEHFSESIGLNPSDQITRRLLEASNLCAWEARGIPVLHLDDYQAAVELVRKYEKAAARTKERGTQAFFANDFTEAVKLLTKALDLDPADTITRRFLELATMRRWEDKGIPVMRLGDYHAAQRLVGQIDRIQQLTAEGLKTWYRQAGFPDEKAMGPEEITSLYKLVVTWQELPLPELYRECSSRSVPTDEVLDTHKHEKQRQQLVRNLLVKDRMDRWDANGYQAHRIGNLFTVVGVVEECERIDSLGLEDVQAWYRELGLPDTSEGEMKDLRKLVTIWCELPTEELLCECTSKEARLDFEGLSKGEVGESGDEDLQRQHMLHQLILKHCMDKWEAQGFHSRRIGDPTVAIQLIESYRNIDAMSETDLWDWYTGCGFPRERAVQPQELVRLLKQVMLWQALPLSELHSECDSLGLGIPQDEESAADDEGKAKQLLVDRLLVDDRMRAWEARGIPSRRLGDIDAAVRVAVEYEHISTHSLDTLLEWYNQLGVFPRESDLDRDQLVALLQAVMLWEAMPLPELWKLCAEDRTKIDPSLRQEVEDSAQQKHALMQELLVQKRLAMWDAKGFQARRIGSLEAVIQLVERYEHWKQAGDEELRQACAEFGLPRSRYLTRGQTLETLRTVLIWNFLPLRELQVDCRQRGLPMHSRRPLGLGNEEERRRELLHRLMGDLRVSAGVFCEPTLRYLPTPSQVAENSPRSSCHGQGAGSRASSPGGFHSMGSVAGSAASPSSHSARSDHGLLDPEVDRVVSVAEGSPEQFELIELHPALAQGADVTEVKRFMEMQSGADAALCGRLIAALRQRKLSLQELPAGDTSECKSLLEELGFSSGFERTKLQKILHAFRLRDSADGEQEQLVPEAPRSTAVAGAEADAA